MAHRTSVASCAACAAPSPPRGAAAVRGPQLLTMAPTHYDPNLLWPLLTMAPTHYGPYSLWPLTNLL
eukprot:scaffold114748_cov39-Phaeocystis_antarctica.AAC.1